MLRIPGVGGVTIQRLLADLEPQQVFETSSANLRALGFSEKIIEALQKPDWEQVEQDLLWLQQPNNYAITFDDQAYPPQLKEISNPPPILFVKGDVSLLLEPQIAMVGSRNPSSSGVKTAIEFAQALAAAGLTITSGLALGIDAASHQGALNVNGSTIAVVGTGLDRVYPASHNNWRLKLLNMGLWFRSFRWERMRKPIIFRVGIGLLVVCVWVCWWLRRRNRAVL